MESKINIYIENGYLLIEKYSKDNKIQWLSYDREKQKNKLRQMVFCLKRMSQCDFLLDM